MAWTKDEAGKVDTLLEGMARIEERCGPCRKEVADHRLMLNGPPDNGTRPGLRSRVDGHDDRIDGHDGEIAGIQQKYRTTKTWLWRVAGGVIASVVGTFIVWAMN